MPEDKIGEVFQYFQKASVAALRMTDGHLKVGDTVHILGNTTDFTQIVDSIQVEHQGVEEARTGDQVGIRVSQRVRPNDVVYKLL